MRYFAGDYSDFIPKSGHTPGYIPAPTKRGLPDNLFPDPLMRAGRAVSAGDISFYAQNTMSARPGSFVLNFAGLCGHFQYIPYNMVTRRCWVNSAATFSQTEGYMMRKVRLIPALSVFLVLIASLSFANQEDDVKALVDNAVTFTQEKGQDYSMKVFNALNGPFFKGPLYIFVGNFNGQILAHPNKKLLEGTQWETKDVKGNLFFQEMVAVAKNGGTGWVEYWWPHPDTKEETLKRSYIKRVPDLDIWIGAGYYAQ
jgi:cytochrome c